MQSAIEEKIRKSMTCAVAFAEWDTPLLAGRHQTGGAPEEGIVAGGDHHRRHLALLGDAPGVPLVAELDTQHVTRNSLLGVDGAEFPVAHRGGHRSCRRWAP
jgi:hypothetical protein